MGTLKKEEKKKKKKDQFLRNFFIIYIKNKGYSSHQCIISFFYSIFLHISFLGMFFKLNLLLVHSSRRFFFFFLVIFYLKNLCKSNIILRRPL